jgi:hypothetical protein
MQVQISSHAKESHMKEEEILSVIHSLGHIDAIDKRREVIENIFKTSSRSVDNFNEESILALGQLMSDKDDMVRYWAAMTLGNIGPAARVVTKQLRQALTEKYCAMESKNSSSAIIFALTRIGQIDSFPQCP